MNNPFLKLKNPAILSPMAGVTDVAFRALCKQYGAGITYTEFVSSAAIVRGNKETFRMLKVDPIEKPVGVQLFGGNVDEVVQAGIELSKTFDIIDVNCGCPAWKVIKTGAGSQMLKKPEGIAAFINKLSSEINKPVTLKIRTGIDEKHINALQVAKLAQSSGAAAITIHGRTQKQGFSGVVDWKIIRQLKEAVDIPVIGNGDVTSPEIFKQRLEESGVDAIMLGRVAMTNPYIFKQINDYLKTGTYEQADKKQIFFEYLTLAQKYELPFIGIKNHAMSFSKGIVGGSKIRQKIVESKNIEELKKLFQNL